MFLICQLKPFITYKHTNNLLRSQKVSERKNKYKVCRIQNTQKIIQPWRLEAKKIEMW